MTVYPPSTTGFIPHGPDQSYKTYYRLFNRLPPPPHTTPIIFLHGGPGATHDYLLPLADLAHDLPGTPLIFYDQLGNGQSTHLPERRGDASFWTPTLFLAELDNLVRHFGLHESGFILLGNSWGGMLASLYAARRPAGLRGLVASNAPADMGVFAAGCARLVAQLPATVRETIRRCEREGTTASGEYRDAVRVFLERHFCRAVPWAREMVRSFEWLERDGSVYLTMNGPSEFSVVGSLKDYSIVSELGKIAVPTLAINGEFDEVRDECVAPFFAKVEKVRWVTLAGAAHASWYDAPERYREIVVAFVKGLAE